MTHSTTTSAQPQRQPVHVLSRGAERAAPPELAIALDAVDDAIVVLDQGNAVIHANAAAKRLLSLGGEAPTPSRLLAELTEADRARLRTHRRWEGHLDLRARAGVQRTMAVELQIVASSHGDQTIVRAVDAAFFADPVTGLPTRAAFMAELDRMLVDLAATRSPACLLLVDVDSFRFVTNSIGPEAGDKILEALAARLQRAFPATTLVARVGGDEFALVCTGTDDVERMTCRVAEACAAPLYLDGNEVQLSVTTGVAISSAAAPVIDGATLLRNADAAVSRAKQGGPGGTEIFDRRFETEARARLDSEQALRRALRNTELRVHYQPLVSLDHGGVVGLEALVRWQPPGSHLRSPASFMDLAESSGLIVPIGRWVLEEACSQLARWDHEGLRMSVNLSIRQLGDDALVDTLHEVLAATGVAPEHLELEITESMLMADVEATAGRLAACKELGVSIAIDDFGTGYSSLQYLRDLPIDVLKIDRSFVSGIEQPGRNRPIVAAVVELARALELTSVAEGVEDAGQLAALRAMGCDLAQGYHITRPLDAAGMHTLLMAAPRW